MSNMINRINSMRVPSLVLTTVLLGQSLQAQHPPLHSPMAIEDHVPKRDLASILQDPPIQQHERLSEALQIIHPIQSGPRCHYQAALNLLNDCKFLETASADTKGDSESNLDQVETVYAARLAVCELLSANVNIPPDCKVVMATKEACVKKRFGYASWFSQPEQPKHDKLCYPEEPNPKQFKRCMKALFAQNQSWMSYSNARQNAVIMCHASRDVIEKEKNLSFYKNLGEAVSIMADVLKGYNEQIKVWLTEHDALVEKIRTSSEQALGDMQEGLTTLDSLKVAFRSFAGMMSRAAESYTQEMDRSLEKSKTSMEQHRQEMQQYHQDLADTSLQHASVQRTYLQQNHDAAVAALQSYHSAALDTLQTNHEAAVAKVIEVVNIVDTIQEKVKVSSKHMDSINEGLISVNRTVERLDAATENLPEMLHILTTLGNIVTNPQLLVAFAICLIGLWKANGKLAGYLIAATGLTYALRLINIQDYARAVKDCFRNNVAPFATSQHPIVLLLIACGLFCLLSFATQAYIQSACLYKYQDDKGEEGVLPSIETPRQPATPPPQNRHRLSIFRTLHSAS